ncbi:hypothetical protein [Methanobacterium sp.]|uniref:hypothetical protein n=1 Tax=Methanobacterium sp. TaxID=2164 RepID=UPI003C78FC79
MNEKYRSPSIIKKELYQVQALIRENEKLKEFSDEIAELDVNSQTLKKKEKYLYKELEISNRILKGKNTFDIVIKGKNIEANNISLSFLGELISNFQDFVDSMVHSIEENRPINKRSSIPQEIKDKSRLDFVGVGSGSVRIVLSSHQLTFEPLMDDYLKCINELIESDDKDEIKTKIDKYGSKPILKYKNFLNTIYENDADLKLYDQIKPEGFQSKEISSDIAKKVHDIIVYGEIIPKKDYSYNGVLKAIDLISDRFKFLTDEKETISGTFDKDLEEIVKEKLDIISTAKFRLSKEVHEIEDRYVDKWELIGFK